MSLLEHNVETPALAVMLPVLTRGLHDKAEKVKRTCCLIVDNMCKVVEDPAAVLPVMNLLEPLVRAATEQIADPEARSVAERAYKTLKKSAEGAESKVVTTDEATVTIKTVLGDKLDAAAELSLTYVASLAGMAANMRCFEADQWASGVCFLAPFSDSVNDIRSKMEIASK